MIFHRSEFRDSERFPSLEQLTERFKDAPDCVESSGKPTKQKLSFREWWNGYSKKWYCNADVQPAAFIWDAAQENK